MRGLSLLSFFFVIGSSLTLSNRLAELSRNGFNLDAIQNTFSHLNDGSAVRFQDAEVTAIAHNGDVDLVATGTSSLGRSVSVVLENTGVRQGDVVTGMGTVTGVSATDDLVVTLDGGAHIQSFSPETHAKRATGRRKLQVYRVLFEGDAPCGTLESPEPCIEPASLDEIYKIVFGPSSTGSVNDLLMRTSNGRYELYADKSSWKTVTVPDGTAYRSLETLFPLKGDEDRVCFFMPQNYFRGIFNGLVAGVATMGKTHAWMQSSDVGSITHEFGHNMGAQHSGRWNTRRKRFEQYKDIGSWMGTGAYVGLGANQLYSLGWLDLHSEIKHITADGTYKIGPLFGATTGVRAAVLETEGWRDGLTQGEPSGLTKGANDVWIEWRSKSGRDAADKSLQYLQHSFDRETSVEPRGQLMGSLLVHTRRGTERLTYPYSYLIGIVEPGSTWTEENSGLQISASLTPGEFTVKNIR